MKILYSIIITISFIACSGYKQIPEEKMQAIISETLISEAVINRITPNMDIEERTKYDSMDIYAPILAKHGYNIGDFKYTITKLAMRKSNPLDNIFQNVALEIERYNAQANDKYRRVLYYDSIATLYYVDTIYRKDTTITGKLAKFKILLKQVPAGKYVVEFDYKTVKDDRIQLKSMSYNAARKTGVKSQSTYWLNRNEEVKPFKAEFELGLKYDTLRISFNDFVPPKDITVIDSSFISNIIIKQFPPLSKARSDYFYEKTGFVPSIKKEYEKRYPYLSDSITIPFKRARRPEPQLSN